VGGSLNGKGFGQQYNAAIRHAVVECRVGGVAGREQYRQFGCLLACLVGKLATIDAGHDDVGEKHADVVALGYDVQCLFATGGLNNGVAKFTQAFGGHLADVEFIINNQENFALRLLQRFLRAIIVGRYVLRSCITRQENLDRHAVTNFGINGDIAACLANKAVDLSKARPAPFVALLVVKNDSKAWARTSGGIPGPVSDIVRTTWSNMQAGYCDNEKLTQKKGSIGPPFH